MGPAKRVRTGWVSYLRVSTNEQAQKDLSLPAQRRSIESYAERHGMKIVREYAEAVSGLDSRRPVFRRMLEDAFSTDGNVAAIVVHHSSRFSRDATEARIVKSKLRKLGVRVHYVCQEITDDPMGVLLEGFFEMIDQYESQINGVRTAAAMREAVRQGYFPGAKAPYGYAKHPVEIRPGVTRNVLVPDEHEAEVLREMFRLYLGENGAKGVARSLNERGLARRNRPWNKDLVLAELERTTAIGTYHWGRFVSRARTPRPPSDWVSLTVQPVVERETFEVARALRCRRAPRIRGRHPEGGRYLLAGVVRCGICGASYQLETSGKGAVDGVYKYTYYNCRASCRSGREICAGYRIPTSVLDSAIKGFIVRGVCGSVRVKALAESLGSPLTLATQERKVRQAREKRTRTLECLGEWETLLAAGGPVPSGANDRLEVLRQELQEADTHLERVERQRAQVSALASLPVPRIEELWTSLITHDEHVARVYLRHLIERIDVHGSRVVVVPRCAA